ncbi:cell division protein PerM [Streptomyces nitrosporeus]|uniref:cell division protein PerM n=1 Tax=Streptomyces nitrosporeus TaxID=28894 RepID=UPI003331E8AD
MTSQVSERSPMLSVERSRSAVLASAFVRGACAAGLGLGAIAVLVMVLWISAPYPDSGPGGAFHVAIGVWLLAHGAELIRTDTLSGHPAPVATVPLLLAVLPVWLMYRAGRDSMEPGDEGEKPRARHSAVGASCAIAAGYLLVTLAAAAYARNSDMFPERLSLAWPLTAVVAGASAAGVWAGRGRPLGSLLVWAPLSFQEAAARARFRAGTRAAARAAAAGVAVLLGGGALLVTVALVWHMGEAQESFLALAGGWAGRVCVLLLALVFVPNAAMWGAAYGLGPGFALGTASTVTPLAFGGRPALPDFPLLAALPAQGQGTAVNWAAAAVPAAAGLAVALFAARAATPLSGEPGGPGVREDVWSPGGTALVVGLAALGCGAGAALLAAASGGPLGTGALAEFGPVWWLTGLAASVWTAVFGVPGALLIRVWRLRERRWAWRQHHSVSEEPPGPAEAGAGEPRRAWWKGRGRVRLWSGRGRGEDERGAAVEADRRDPLADDYVFLAAESWHTETARKARWSALRKNSGGLMADFAATPATPAPPGAVLTPTPAGHGADGGTAAEESAKDADDAGGRADTGRGGDGAGNEPVPADEATAGGGTADRRAGAGRADGGGADDKGAGGGGTDDGGAGDGTAVSRTANGRAPDAQEHTEPGRKTAPPTGA